MNEISKQENQISFFYKQLSETGSLTSSMEDYLQTTRLALQKRKAELMEEFQHQVPSSINSITGPERTRLHQRAFTVVEDLEGPKLVSGDSIDLIHKRHNSINAQKFDEKNWEMQKEEKNDGIIRKCSDDLNICRDIVKRARNTIRLIKDKVGIIREKEKIGKDNGKKNDLIDVVKGFSKPPLSPLKLGKSLLIDEDFRKIVEVI